MKKSNARKKLALTSETLKVLESHSLRHVAAGVERTRDVPCPAGTAKVDCG